jgi:stage III sporulation protein AG
MGKDGMEIIGKIKAPFKGVLGGDLRLKVIVLLGLLGMALVAISQFLPEKTGPQEFKNAVFTSSEYVREMETRISELIAGMQGAGRVRVMITLENAGETVYAQEETRNVDKREEAVPNSQATATTTSQKENVEQRYILVDGENGREALVKTKLEPRIQGVVILCDGADSIKVEQSITHVVTTALNIPTTRVCVAKISN